MASSESAKRKRPDAPQRDALDAIYHCLGGPQWTNREHWCSEDHHWSEWSGVRCCSGEEKRITALELSQNNLRGRLDDPAVSSALLKLASSLEQLWLSENNLSGNLPAVLATDFPKLSILDVGSNMLSGSLHPAFGATTQFSWFDTSGNELTSYYRYTTDKDSSLALDLDLSATSNPLEYAFVVPSLLSKEQARNLVDLALTYTKNNGGWETDRHKAYKTTDVDIAVCSGDLLDVCNSMLKTRILPLLANLFEFPIADFAIEDLFLAKYSATKGEQSALLQHRDGSELSFVITLNDPKTEFTGGGTRFAGATVAPDTPGTGVFFCGRYLHSGVEVTEGTRYILAGFVRVYPSTPEGKAKLACMLKAVAAQYLDSPTSSGLANTKICIADQGTEILQSTI
jgi:hypothetical protein